MDWKPPIENIQFIHAEGDFVVGLGENEWLANTWGVPLHKLTSIVENGKTDPMGDDIHHDFMAKDLLHEVVNLFEQFLDQCSNEM